MSKDFYRRDIDGLRALAIIPVLLFHAGINWFSGGFVGVDVFFVISGYLITSIILKELHNKTFSFTQFYTRRFRRLFPAGFTVILLTVLGFSFIYPEHLFIKTVESAIASILFAANFYFWQQGGYFNTGLHLQPLLHTWSLGVEEQFYFVFPISLFVLFKFKMLWASRYILLISTILVSLILAIIYAPSSTSYIGFYLLPTRYYELAIGSFAALLIFENRLLLIKKLKFLREIGIILIVYTIIFFNEQTPFPSYFALIPVIGTILIILDNTKSGAAYNLLSSKVMVFTGLISYSLYLWHWPVFVAHKWLLADNVSALSTIVSIALSFLLAYLSYLFIETPFRNKQRFTDPQIRTLSATTGVFLLAIFMVSMNYGNSFIYDTDKQYTTVYNQATSPEPYREECFDTLQTFGKLKICSFPQEKEMPKLLLWGDSHGSAFIPALSELNKAYNVDFVNNSGCPPLFSIIRNAQKEQCSDASNQLLEQLEENTYEKVILVGAWNNYINWNLISNDMTQNSADAFKDSVAVTMDIFEKMETSVYFIDQPPRFPKEQALEYIKSKVLRQNPPIIKISTEEFETQSQEYKKTMDSMQIQTVNFDNVYCNDVTCDAIKNEVIMFKDSHHISNDQATMMSKSLSDKLESLNRMFQ